MIVIQFLYNFKYKISVMAFSLDDKGYTYVFKNCLVRGVHGFRCPVTTVRQQCMCAKFVLGLQESL